MENGDIDKPSRAADATIRFVFTEARVRALKPPASDRATYYDALQPGFQLRVTANGTKSFCVYRRVRGGAPTRVHIGKWPDCPVEEARSKAQHYVAKLASAEDPAEARRKLKAERTLEQLFVEYLADRKKAGRRSLKAIRELWERYVGAPPVEPRKKHGALRSKAPEGVDWSKRRMSEITTEHLASLHTHIANSGKTTTANRVLELLRAMYGYAKRHRFHHDNPAEGVTFSEETPRTRFAKVDELPKLIKSINAEAQPWRDYFTVLLYVGYRKIGVASMSWSDIDLRRGTWAVPGERAKNGEPIVLPLVGPALEVLRRRYKRRESEQWVFPGNSRHGHITQPRKAWRRILARAGIENFWIHDLRRTLGSYLAMSGVSPAAIGRILGHKDTRSTEIYARMQAEAVSGAASLGHQAMKAAIKTARMPVPATKQRRRH